MKKKILFSKMHGLGNDFVIVNTIHQKFFPRPKIIRMFARRTLGIGFDQLLILRESHSSRFDFYCQIFNSDGTESFQCGNGFRCLAKYIYVNINKKPFHIIRTKKHTVITSIKDRGKEITVNMGTPRFISKKVLTVFQKEWLRQLLTFEKEYNHFEMVNIGNSHLVFIIQDSKEIVRIFRLIHSSLRINELFPKGININLMQIINRKKIFLKVYERGSGETKSCGSGACAAVAFGIKDRLLKNLVSVRSKGGYLKIYWNGKNSPIFMKGSAKYVYEGSILM